MDAARIAVAAATAAVLAWAAKAVAIGVAGGLDQSPAEGPLFLLGLLCGVVAAGALGVSAVRGAPVWVRVLAAIGAVLALLLVTGLTSNGFAAVATNDHWVWSEVGLWIVAIALLALAAWHSSRRAPASTQA